MGVASDWYGARQMYDNSTVYISGQSKQLRWSSPEKAITALVNWGILEEDAAMVLMTVSVGRAKMIIDSMGPEVRNPSGYVDKAVKNALKELMPASRFQKVCAHYNTPSGCKKGDQC